MKARVYARREQMNQPVRANAFGHYNRKTAAAFDKEADVQQPHVARSGHTFATFQVHASDAACTQRRFELMPIQDWTGQTIRRSTVRRIVKNGYTTFLVPIPGDQKLIVQFYREPRATEGAMLRFKVQGDHRAPHETPIPADATFNPTLIRQSDDLISFGFTSNSRVDMTIYLAAGRAKELHDAINPEKPWGPLLLDKEFQRAFAEILIAHPGGTETYSWTGELPDEAIAPSTWQPYVHGGRLPGYRAIRGRYQRRILLHGTDIKAGERAAVRGFQAGALAAAKFFGSLAVYSIPYVGPLVLIGEAVTGRTIWGDKLSTEARILFGLLALLPIAVAARSTIAEARAATELAAARGITKTEALTLIRGSKAFTNQERAFIESTTKKIKAGKALTEAEAARAAALLNKIGTQEQLIFSGANDIQLIWSSRRYWGQTEGAAYGARLPVTNFLQRMKAMIGKKEGLVIFQGQAAKLFSAHKVEGGYSAMKRLLGQHKAGFGDIVFDSAIKQGNTIVVTKAHLATAAEIQHAGQTTGWALARLWGRRITLEPLATAAVPSAGSGVYMLYEWISKKSSEK